MLAIIQFLDSRLRENDRRSGNDIDTNKLMEGGERFLRPLPKGLKKELRCFFRSIGRLFLLVFLYVG